GPRGTRRRASVGLAATASAACVGAVGSVAAAGPRCPRRPRQKSGWPPDRVVDAVRRLAVLSMHTSPLAQPGAGDGGGMNVYVRELCAALARSGVTCEVFTRADDPA